MNGFLTSFRPVLKKLGKFKTEIFILSIASVIGVISLLLYLKENQISSELLENPRENVVSAMPPRVLIDIAGAVENPGVYETTTGARLKDALILAGGLSANAERDYISRNFNLAKLVMDQEKIYIPSQTEVSSGIFTEPQKILDYTSAVQNFTIPVSPENTQKININSATLEELDTLPGIGNITAQKIIQNRPYKNVEELSLKKIVNKNIYERIKNLVFF